MAAHYRASPLLLCSLLYLLPLIPPSGVCLCGGAVPLREQRASYSGPNVITLYKLGVTEAGGAHRLMTFYCYCSATINCSPLLLLLLRAPT